MGNLTAALLIGAAMALKGGEWTEWRGGPERSGIWSERLPEKLDEDGPRILWKKTIGTGYSGPAVKDGLVVLLDRVVPSSTNKVELERILCFDAETGREKWVHSYACTLKLRSGYENGPRGTPTLVGDRVYALGAMGNLNCLDLKTGKIIWSKNFVSDFDAEIPDWGVVNPPLIEGDRLFVQVGGRPNATVMALDKSTGRELWRNITNRAGYAPIVGITSAKQRQLIVWTADCLYSLKPEDGSIFWSHPRKLAWNQAIATPVFDSKRDLLLFSSDREGTLALKLNSRKPGCEVAWDNFSFSALHSSPVLLGDHLYGLNHNGAEKEHCGEFRCVDPETGKVAWSVDTLTPIHVWAQASVTYNRGNNLFYITNELGELVMARADPRGYHEIARYPMTGKTWTHPAYADGRIFMRSESTLVAASLK